MSHRLRRRRHGLRDIVVYLWLGRLGTTEGTVKLFGVERDEGVAGCGVALIGVVSASRGKADYVVPGGEAGGHFSAVGTRGEAVAAGPEVR